VSATDESLLSIEGLNVAAPGGRRILKDVGIELRPGEIVALLGGSGAGKSTLMTALHDPNELRGNGFEVQYERRHLATPIGIVPQRGALFDHLSAAGNLAVAMRNAVEPRSAQREAIAKALDSVDLPPEWSSGAREVDGLSGGEAQRLAVARTLAGGRRILFLDEPSVGLDPLRVDRLADLLREEMDEREAAALVVTHELEFAAGVADRFIFMSRDEQGLVELEVDVPEGERSREARVRVASDVAVQMIDRLEREAPPEGQSAGGKALRWLKQRADGLLAPFAVVPEVLLALPRAIARPRDFFEVFSVTLKQTMLRPAAFFAIVSLLIGFTLLYILHRSLGGGELPVRPDKVFSLIGSMHVIAIAPALTGILFSATSGNAITAWLGGMSLTRQTQALRALGIPEPRYLWLPAWVALVVAFALMSVIFVGGMLVGGTIYLTSQVPEMAAAGWDPAWHLVTADLFDPPPDRVVFRSRMFGLLGLYAVGIASDAVAKGSSEKRSAEAVTISMVRAVMATTSWIVALELGTLVYVYGGLN
jgi:ABC-type multidrug transport system ATPase subunit